VALPPWTPAAFEKAAKAFNTGWAVLAEGLCTPLNPRQKLSKNPKKFKKVVDRGRKM